MAYFSEEELHKIGLKCFGENVKISTRASIYRAENISIGSHVRIDDYCIISAGNGGIFIGSYVHIAAYSSLIGSERIELNDFSGLSARVSIYSSSDDYSGKYMTNPTVPSKYTGVHHATVSLGRHAIVGTGAVILPGTILEEGVAIGALSLVKGRCREFGIYFGTPAKRISERKKNLLELENQLISSGKAELKNINA
ncbi:MAG: acyltransferase [Candidatus Competibacteraceae bacterium]|nr:acyltransferase [Candidatus Competibacteraceae bacterium]